MILLFIYNIIIEKTRYHAVTNREEFTDNIRRRACRANG